MAKVLAKTRVKINEASGNIFLAILEELRALRNEIAFFLPQESLKGYAHPKKIKSSYERALAKHPPSL